jgi:hypothetical protein
MKEARVRVRCVSASGWVIEDRIVEVSVGEAPVEEDAAVAAAVEELESKWIGRVVVTTLAD